jgi:hypothetical protein
MSLTFCLSGEAVNNNVRRTQSPFIIYNLSFIIYNWTQGLPDDGIRGDLMDN